MRIRNALTIMGLLAVLAVVTAGHAVASVTATWAPSAYDIEGDYALSGKGSVYNAHLAIHEKESYQAVFRITRISDSEVELASVSENGQVGTGRRARYMNGVLLLTWGDDTMDPTSQMEDMILEFSGAPGKIKFSGKYFYYYMDTTTTGMDTLKGKMIPA